MYTKMFRDADPARAALEQRTGELVNADLVNPYQMTDQERQEVQGAARGAQAARGNNLGFSSAVAEATNTGDRMRQLYNDRLSRAMQFEAAPGIVNQAQ